MSTSKRSAIFEVSRPAIIDFILEWTDFRSLYPDADHIAVHFDFDSDAFWFKFRHPSLEEVPSGAPHPRIAPPTFRGRP